MRTQTKDAGKCLSCSRFISTGKATPNSDQHLAFYVVDVEDYIEPKPDIMEEDLKVITSEGFLERSKDVLKRYEEIVKKKQERLRPYIQRYPNASDGSIPIVIGIRSVTQGDPSQTSAAASSIPLGRDRGMNTIITEMLGKELTARR